MIQANIIAVDQRFDFRTKTIRSYAVFELGGKEVRAEVESIDEVKTLINAGLDGVAPSPPPQEEAPPPGVTPTPAGQEPQREETLFTDQPQPDEVVVSWQQLPDEVVSPMMKSAMAALEVPPEIPASALQQLMGDIVETFSAEDWASLGYELPQQAPPPVQQTPPPQPPPQAPVQPPPQPAQPPVGQITWTDGSPIMPGVARRARTVQSDDFGYPIVSSSDVDPGEVVGSGDDIDEDGVGSM
jgi:hypothetical protein